VSGRTGGFSLLRLRRFATNWRVATDGHEQFSVYNLNYSTPRDPIYNRNKTAVSHTPFFSTIQKRRLLWLPMKGNSLFSTLCLPALDGHFDGTRPRGRPSKRWTDDIREWTGMTIVECIQTAVDRVAWRAVTSPIFSNEERVRRRRLLTSNNQVVLLVDRPLTPCRATVWHFTPCICGAGHTQTLE